MGCVQSKTVTRQIKSTENGTTPTNGVARQPAYQQDNTKHDDKDTDRNIDLDMHSPRTSDTTSGLPNGNLRGDTIESLEDREPICELPDTMTIYTVSDKRTSLSISNVSLKQRDSAQSRGLTSSQFSTDLSIEELDTEMDDFSKLRLVYERPVRPKSESHILRNKTFVVNNGLRTVPRPTSERLKPVSFLDM